LEIRNASVKIMDLGVFHVSRKGNSTTQGVPIFHHNILHQMQ
jgi:hypothetical protein